MLCALAGALTPAAAAQTANACQAPPAAQQPAEAGVPAKPREVTVTAIPGIIAARAKFTHVFQTVGNNFDGVVAAPRGGVLATQEDNNAVVWIDQNDRASVFIAGAAGAGSLSIDRQGRLFTVQRIAQPGTPAATQPSAPKTAGIAMLLPERKVWDTFEDGTKMIGRPSDLSADSTGGAYFTQLCVYYASAAGRISLVGQNLRGNGIVLSPDDKRLYVTNGGSIVVFDVQAPGKLTSQREFATLGAGGNADGITVDTNGRVYVAAGPGVQIFTPEGKYIGVIPTPQGRPTGEVFAGPDRKTLYVVVEAASDAVGNPITGRSVYRIPMLAQGLPNRSK
jgi:gluconolactonase